MVRSESLFILVDEYEHAAAGLCYLRRDLGRGSGLFSLFNFTLEA
jgi:hypothetical protein